MQVPIIPTISMKIRALGAAGWSWAVLGLSALLATMHWIGGRPFWLDEAMVALNLQYLAPAELAGPLEFEQIAPIGWLRLEQALLMVPFPQEHTLRAPSLAAWIASLFLVRDVCFRRFPQLPALAAFALFAFSAGALRYAVELKPYGLDLFFGAASLWAADRIIALDSASGTLASARAAWMSFAATGVNAALFSFGGCISFAAAGCAIVLHQARARAWRGVALAVAICASAAAIFLALYLGVYRFQIAGTSLVAGSAADFFRGSYYAALAPSPGTVRWYVDWWFAFIEFHYDKASRGLLSVALAIGILLASLRRPWLAIAALGPLALGLLASATQSYPMFQRLTLFSFPGLSLAMGALFERTAQGGAGSRLAIGVLVAGGLAGSAATITRNTAIQPPYARQDLRPALAHLEGQWRSGDRLYVSRFSTPPFTLYRRLAPKASGSWIAGATPSEKWVCVLLDMPRLSPADRIWILVSETTKAAGEVEMGAALAAMDINATVTLAAKSHDVFLYRLDVAGTGTPSTISPLAEACRPSPRDGIMHASPRLQERLARDDEVVRP